MKFVVAARQYRKEASETLRSRSGHEEAAGRRVENPKICSAEKNLT
jgi:hypothetical protein